MDYIQDAEYPGLSLFHVDIFFLHRTPRPCTQTSLEVEDFVYLQTKCCGLTRSCLSIHALVLLKSTIISFAVLTLTERLLSLLRLSGCLTSSQRCRQQNWWYDWTDVRRCSRGSAVFVMKWVVTVWGLLISKSRTHIRWEESVLLCCRGSVCVGVLSRHSYQLLNHPSNYRGNRASITPSIIQGRQTERQNSARDVTGEWSDNKGRGEEGGG